MFPLNGSGGSTAMQGIKLTDVFALLQLQSYPWPFNFKGEMEEDKELPIVQPHKYSNK